MSLRRPTPWDDDEPDPSDAEIETSEYAEMVKEIGYLCRCGRDFISGAEFEHHVATEGRGHGEHDIPDGPGYPDDRYFDPRDFL